MKVTGHRRGDDNSFQLRGRVSRVFDLKPLPLILLETLVVGQLTHQGRYFGSYGDASASFRRCQAALLRGESYCL